MLEGELSDSTRVISGVPQGSVLGPILFLFYINDLPQSLQSNVRLFADDTLLYLTIHSLADTRILQSDLLKLEHWEKRWSMEFNPDKCEVLRVTRGHQPIIVDYVLHGKALKVVDHAKYLGVIFTSDFRWNKHVLAVTKKANQTLGLLRRNLKIKSTSLKSTAYKTLVRPLLEYASSAWDPFTQREIHMLEMVQRRAARYVMNRYNKQSSVTDMLNELKWETLELRREKRRLEMLYKIHHELVGISKENLKPRSYRSRHSHQLAYEIPSSATDYHRYSFYPRTIRKWNSIPVDILNAKSLAEFKLDLSKHLNSVAK